MLDKVLKAWECCNPFNRRCFECPYEDVCFHDNFDRVAIADMVVLLKEQQTRLLTFEEVKDHYSVPVSKLQIEKYNDYAEDIKPLYFEFPNPDGWVLHWRGYDKVSTYLREWEKDYGRTWRCWTDKPTDEQRKAEPWKDGEQE